MSTDTAPSELERKVVQGISKLGLALRHNQQTVAGPHGLTPTQAQILALVAAEPDGVALRWISDGLGVTAATASDAVRILVAKGLVDKAQGREDRRSIRVALTAAGRTLIDRIGLQPPILLDTVEELDTDEQAALLRVLVKLIRSLQRRGEIPIARMCATCQHFRPNVHDDTQQPHHCAFVDAAFGERQHMIDCPDHAALAAKEQEIVWRRYVAGASAPPNPSS